MPTELKIQDRVLVLPEWLGAEIADWHSRRATGTFEIHYKDGREVSGKILRLAGENHQR